MDFLRRVHEKTNQNISRSSCQNNEALGEKGERVLLKSWVEKACLDLIKKEKEEV